MLTIMSAIPPTFSMIHALKCYERLRLCVAVVKYLIHLRGGYRFSCCLLPPADFKPVLQLRLCCGRSGQQRSVLRHFQTVPSQPAVPTLTAVRQLLFHNIPRVSSAWWRHEKFRNANPSMPKTGQRKHRNELRIVTRYALFTFEISVFNKEDSLLDACGKTVPPHARFFRLAVFDAREMEQIYKECCGYFSTTSARSDTAIKQELIPHVKSHGTLSVCHKNPHSAYHKCINSCKNGGGKNRMIEGLFVWMSPLTEVDEFEGNLWGRLTPEY